MSDPVRSEPLSLPRRYFLTLAYRGTDFLGWQAQQEGRTVQGVLQEKLSILLRREISVTGCGRTDTGVHASRYVCHLDLPLSPVEARELLFRANRFLPRDLRLYDIRPVRPAAHARFDALSRSYGYHVTLRPTPFDYEVRTPLPARGTDFGRMNEAALCLIGTHDFTTFSKTGSDVRSSLCTVTEARWQQEGEFEWAFRYSANRFLRNMVRATVGTLFDVGRGKITPGEFARRLDARNRTLASSSAPPEGLFLENVLYPPELFLTDSENDTP